MKLLIAALALAASLVAAGPYGADNGWAIANDGSALLTPAAASEMVAGGVTWVRIEMRLIPGHVAWDDQMLGFYDAAVDNARAAGLIPLLLIDGGSWPGGQSDWEQNSSERTGGNGCNDYNSNFASQAVVPLVLHFRSRVKIYEIWNEPNAWTQSYGTGGTFMYPSNYSCLLARSWSAVHATSGIEDVKLIFGGVFGHSIGGQYSYTNAGAQYIEDTYAIGIGTGTFTDVWNQYGAYPVDGIGQHIYIDQGGAPSPDRIAQYLAWVRQAYTKYEGADTAKQSFITEVGWTTRSISPALQDQNLVTTFQTLDRTPFVRMAIWFQWRDNPPQGSTTESSIQMAAPNRASRISSFIRPSRVGSRTVRSRNPFSITSTPWARQFSEVPMMPA